MANEIKVTVLKEFAKNLNSISKNLSDTRKVHAETVVLYEQWVRRNFQAQGKNHEQGSLRWKKLSPVTLMKRRTRKRAPNTSSTILIDHGQLRSRWFRNITTEQAVLTSGQDYSSIHEHGGKSVIQGKSINVPQRKIFPEKKQGVKIIKPAIDRYIQKSFGK